MSLDKLLHSPTALTVPQFQPKKQHLPYQKSRVNLPEFRASRALLLLVETNNRPVSAVSPIEMCVHLSIDIEQAYCFSRSITRGIQTITTKEVESRLCNFRHGVVPKSWVP